MASNSKRSISDVAAAAKRSRGRRNFPTEEGQQLQPDDSSSTYSDICTYCTANLAFDPLRVLLRRLLFLNTNKTKYVSVGFYPACDYLPLLEFGVIRSCRSKAIILTYKQVYTLAQCLPAVADAMWKEGKEEDTPFIKCESGNFLLGMPKRRRGFSILYVGSEYISLPSLDLH